MTLKRIAVALALAHVFTNTSVYSREIKQASAKPDSTWAKHKTGNAKSRRAAKQRRRAK